MIAVPTRTGGRKGKFLAVLAVTTAAMQVHIQQCEALPILTGGVHIAVDAAGGCAEGSHRFAGAPNPGATGAAGSTPTHHGDNLGVGLRHLRLLRNNGGEHRTKGVIQECRGNKWYRLARSRDSTVATQLCAEILRGNNQGQVCGRAYEDEM